MVKIKKLIIFVLSAIMAFSVVGCSKGSTGNNPNGPSDTTFQLHTVTFDVGAEARAAGVSVNPSTKKVEHGGTLSSLPDPSGWLGHVLTAWYLGSAEFTLSTVVNEDITVVAHWEEDSDSEDEQAYYDSIAEWCEKDHFYLHYMRYDHKESEEGTLNGGNKPNYDTPIASTVYEDRGLWAWPKNNDGRLFNAARIDGSGAIYDIDLKTSYNDAGWDEKKLEHKNGVIKFSDVDYLADANIGIQLFSIASRRDKGFWTNDGGDVYLNLKLAREINGSYHWFVTQGAVGKGSRHYTGAAAIPNSPYKGDDGTKFGTKVSGDKLINSNVNNSAKYPVWPNKAAGYEDDGVGYQVFLASFKDSDGDGMGDLGGVIEKIDDNYFSKLNVDVLWITPFQTSTGYHGYDISDYYSVDPRFGTLATYRELVYKAHQKGIKVVMDFVLNHTAQSNEWYVKSQNLVKDTEKGIDYRNFYTWITEAQYQALHNCTPDSKEADEHKCAKDQYYKDDYGYYFYSSFSSTQPELNYDYQPVRDAILDVCNYWMAFGLDGFRLDAVKHIYMSNEVVGKGNTLSTGNIDNGEGCIDDGLYSHDVTRNLNFYREFNYRLKSTYPNAILIGENLDGNPRDTTNYYQGIDSQFNFNLYYDVTRAFAAADRTGNGGEANAAVTAYMQGYYGNSYTKDNGEQVNVKGYATVNPNFIDGLFTSNHDLPRARDRLNIEKIVQGSNVIDKYHSLTESGSIERTDNLLPLYYAYIMTMPGLNWIYYGDEIGMSGIMDFTIQTGSTSSTDSKPHEDRVYRQPMKWYTDISKNSEYKIGYEDFGCKLEGVNATNSIKSVEAQDGVDGSLLEWMRTLTKVRRENKVLINGVVTKSTNGGISGSTIYYEITKGSEKVTVYLNLGSSPFTVNGTNILASRNMSGKTLNQYGVAIVKG